MTPDDKPSLGTFPFFHGLGPERIAIADVSAQWMSVPAGRPLYESGDPSDAIYGVTSGALAVHRTSHAGEPQIIGHVRAGELVGEMSFFARHPRRSTVTALRDSELLRIDQDLMRSLLQARPDLMEEVTRLILRRAEAEIRPNTDVCPKVIAFISVDREVDARICAEQLAVRLRGFGETAAVIGSEVNTLRSGWFDEIESGNDYVLLAASLGEMTWARTCLRQADRTWILCRTLEDPPESLLAHEPGARRLPLLFDLVAVGADPLDATRVSRWRGWCAPARLMRWDLGNEAAAARMARVITGRSVGLVLSGGGARAYAHIGVVRAMREARIPIDLVGGTSMGAIVAATVAMGWDDDEIDWRIRDAFVSSNPLGDFVLPVVALTSGGRVAERLERHFGNALIEDLELPFFSVSASLTTGQTKIHQSGLLREALRATISLPGILPPVIDHNDLLVDGAVLDNFPVTQMRHLHAGPVIGVDVAQVQGLDLTEFMNPPGFIGWVLRNGLRAPPPIVSLMMKAGTAAIDPARNRAQTDLLIVPEMPGIDLRDWKLYDGAVTAGYEAAVQALGTFDWHTATGRRGAA